MTETPGPVRETTVGGVLREAAERAVGTVAVWAPNSPEWLLMEFGAALTCLTLVTVNPAVGPGHQGAHAPPDTEQDSENKPTDRSEQKFGFLHAEQGLAEAPGTA